MADLPTTRPSLLLRLRDAGDAEAWREFAQLYGPVVYRYGRNRGLQDADAADLTQEVLRSVAAGIGRLAYDRRRGSFSGWLFTLAHRRLYDQLERLRREPRGAADSAVRQLLAEHPAPGDEAAWRQEYEQRLFDWAAERARPAFQESTWRAFWMTAVEGRAGQEAASTLGVTVAAVYLAKGRVLARIKELIEEVEGG